MIQGAHKVFEFGTPGEQSQALLDALTWCKVTRKAKYDGEVSKAFAEFDKDASGAIDKEELAELSAKLGFELDEEQTALALKDLDLNGDGVIDKYEFARWYFTGMKPYNGAKRSMLKVGKGVKTLYNTMARQVSQTFDGKLKTRTHSLHMGFNAPENPATSLGFAMHLPGTTYNAEKARLE